MPKNNNEQVQDSRCIQRLPIELLKQIFNYLDLDGDLNYLFLVNIRLMCSRFRSVSESVFQEKTISLFAKKINEYAENGIAILDPRYIFLLQGTIPPILCLDVFTKLSSYKLEEQEIRCLIDRVDRLSGEQQLLLIHLEKDTHTNKNLVRFKNVPIANITTPLLLWAALFDYKFLFKFLLNVVKTKPNIIMYKNRFENRAFCYSSSFEDLLELYASHYRCQTSVLIEVLDKIKDKFEIERLYKVAEELFDHGANPDFLQPLHKYMPTEKEAKTNFFYLDVIKLLLKYGADVNLRNTEGCTVLQRVEELKTIKLDENKCLENVKRVEAIVKCAYYFNEAIKRLNNPSLNFFSSFAYYLSESRMCDLEFFDELVSHYLTKSWPYKRLSPRGQEKLKQWYQQQNQQGQEYQSQPQIEPAGFTP